MGAHRGEGGWNGTTTLPEGEACRRGMHPVAASGMGSEEGMRLRSDEGGLDGDLAQGRQGTTECADVDQHVIAGVQ